MLYKEKYLGKGSFAMFSYITENTYITIETMHYEMRGLNFVCRYRDYEEK